MINFIRYKLKPEIDSRFNTLSDRDHTAIGGGSRCALLALYAGLLAPRNIFKGIGYVSCNADYRKTNMKPYTWTANGMSGMTRSGNYMPVCNDFEWWLAHNQAPTENVKYCIYRHK